jgi:hypothetical protein
MQVDWKKMKLETEILDPLSSDSEEDEYGEEQWERRESLLKTRDLKEHCEDWRNHGRRLEERGEAESRKDDRSKENFRQDFEATMKSVKEEKGDQMVSQSHLAHICADHNQEREWILNN